MITQEEKILNHNDESISTLMSSSSSSSTISSKSNNDDDNDNGNDDSNIQYLNHQKQHKPNKHATTKIKMLIPCPHDGCGKWFTQTSHLKSHLLTHSSKFLMNLFDYFSFCSLY